jgi:FKBP-type peptidyl-prolyl cis-trans isomerase SlyD
MHIAENTVVTIDYTLTDTEGNILDRAIQGGFAYLHGANNIVPGLEDALTGKTSGDKLQVNVPPEQGYGERDERLMQVIQRDAFGTIDKIEPGQQFHAQAPSGAPLVVTVTQVEDNNVTIDCNHPLAGETLNFDVEVLDVRSATDDEMAHGHAHSPGQEHDH